MEQLPRSMLYTIGQIFTNHMTTLRTSKTRSCLQYVVVILMLGTGLLTAQTAVSSTTTSTTTSNAASAKSTDPKEITPVLAEKPASASPFQFDIGIPVWSSGISGVTGVKGVQGHVSQSFSSLWDHMDYVVPLTMDFRYQKFGFHIDGQFVKLNQFFNTRGILYNTGDISMEQAFCNFDLDYRVLDTERWFVDPYIGGRYNYLSLAGTLNSRFPKIIPNLNMNASTSWVDPIIGVNTKVHIYKPCSLLMLGDVGGFGVNSHITYQFYGGGEVQIARHFYMDLGYRYLYTDYSSGGFIYNVDMKGPEVTFGGNF